MSEDTHTVLKFRNLCKKQPKNQILNDHISKPRTNLELNPTFFVFFNWDSLHAFHLLQGIELQEKEAQKDQCTREICVERTYS